MASSVHIVILNWNGLADTLECLASIRKLKYENLRVHVVDNGSLNGESTKIAEQFPETNVIALNENAGFCGGANVGMRAALEEDADFIILLNNDTLVSEDLIAELLAGYRSMENVGAVSPVILKYPEVETIWFSKAEWAADWSSGVAGFKLTTDESIEELRDAGPYESEFACGCCLLVSADVVRSVGMLDERYFAFFDEADWCSRMQRNGLKSFVIPNAQIFHRVGRSTPDLLMTYLLTRNAMLWVSENLPFRQRWKTYRVMSKAFGWHVMNVLHLIRKKKQHCPRSRSLAYLLGWKDNLLGRYGKWSVAIEPKLLPGNTNEGSTSK